MIKYLLVDLGSTCESFLSSGLGRTCPVRVHVWVQVAKTSDAALILQLLQAGANPDVADPACGLTLLHDTSREGFDHSVRVLLEHGADANRVDVEGNLPLHVAAREGHLKVVQLLIGKTAKPDQDNNEGFTALLVAWHHEKTDTVQYLQSI